VSIEDRLVENRLTEEGERLITLGRTTPARVLIQQLGRNRCQLNLPQQVPVVQDPVELFQVAKDSVVVIAGLYRCERCSQWHTSIASGFVVASSGAVVTNYHVVDNPNQETMVAMTADQRVFPVEEVLAASRADDLAILKVAADDLRPLPVANASAAAPVGSTVSVVSHPDGRFYCYTSGIVSRYMRIRSAGQHVDAVSITADYARGSSGAPVLSSQGMVVAVVMSTESIYYTEDGQRQRNLQMVFKTCIPSKSLHKLVQPYGQAAGRTAPGLGESIAQGE